MIPASSERTRCAEISFGLGLSSPGVARDEAPIDESRKIELLVDQPFERRVDLSECCSTRRRGGDIADRPDDLGAVAGALITVLLLAQAQPEERAAFCLQSKLLVHEEKPAEVAEAALAFLG